MEYEELALIKQQKYQLMNNYGMTLAQINSASAKGLKQLQRYSELQHLRKQIIGAYMMR